jgi:predicted negative regulator of RcsB-dependent stress response
MRRLGLLALLLTSGCVYYNSMYNTRKFAHEAEKAEREGRTIDAGTAWGQVTVKAETLLARHPGSRYVPEARVRMGQAYARLGDCSSARQALEAGLAMLQDSVLVRDGRIALARCLVELDDANRAVSIYRSLLASASDSLRDALRPEFVHALGRAGDYRAALRLVVDSTPAARRERLLLLAGAGEGEHLLALADTIAASGDSLVPWDSVARAAARSDPEAASRILDRGIDRSSLTVADRARWLLEDAARLAPLDSARAMARYQAVLADVSSRDFAAQARLGIVAVRLVHLRELAGLDSVLAALAPDLEDSPLSFRAQGLASALQELITIRDSVTSATPQGDMRTFLGGELARDSLRSRGLARALFVRVADLWPTSPYAAKGLLAARLLTPRDSALAARLDSAYAGSPYLLAVQGESSPGLRALEDSLGAYAAAAARRAAPAPRPGTPRRPSSSQPGQRPAPGQRVPEPQ